MPSRHLLSKILKDHSVFVQFDLWSVMELISNTPSVQSTEKHRIRLQAETSVRRFTRRPNRTWKLWTRRNFWGASELVFFPSQPKFEETSASVQWRDPSQQHFCFPVSPFAPSLQSKSSYNVEWRLILLCFSAFLRVRLGENNARGSKVTSCALITQRQQEQTDPEGEM